jgi:hypothetical protein
VRSRFPTGSDGGYGARRQVLADNRQLIGHAKVNVETGKIWAMCRDEERL